MMERIKIQKILAVLLLTVLIWVWSDLALDEQDYLTQIPVELGDSSDPSLLVSFVTDSGELTDRMIVNTINLKGPGGRIVEIKKLERTDALDLNLVLTPDKQGLNKPMDYPAWPLENFVKQSPEIGNRGLSVESCAPDTASIRVIKLAQRSLAVRCVDENETVVPGSQVTPASINMYVPEDWVGEKLVANVVLSEADLSRARGETAIDRVPFVDIDGRRKTAKLAVKVHLSEEVTNLEPQVIEKPKFCLVVDPIVQRDYKIVIMREEEALRSIEFKGTDEAKRAYQNETYHVELVVERKAGPQSLSQSKTLEYRFPRAYVEKNQIKPADSPLATIDFELVPRASSSATTTPP
ncbi:MAG: hypothetical protein K9N55_04345 [Phycisphaerae bacterium]|nr:hypothetical protein [Phycisphaerae bacterium]